MSHPFYAYLLLLRPARVTRHLEAAQRAGVVDASPNTWQLCLGALRMWHRILFRQETIGTSSGPPPRAGLRAKLLEVRAIRAPFLLFEGAVAPWDLTGLLSSPQRITRHLLAAHHDKNQFVFDFQILAAHPGRLARLVEKASAIVTGTDERSEWLRDLTVFEHYHETLLEAAEAAARGDFRLSARDRDDPDLSLTGLLRWCAAGPPTPLATLRALRNGSFSFAPRGQHHEHALA